ncbi:DUF7577 domain-containing protein [Halococcus agarilyticus]|uniref:DUF7577 domain-containing protein n=1 Tax=Halococcus agarilyticus TaxID=1232219 RepID=UPI0012AB7102|nr:zinc ribbon domain-containing protein [Halococcus agarilyticus]
MTELRSQVLWAGVAVLCYIVAALAFLAVVAEAGIVGPGPGSVGSVSIVGMIVSVLLFVAGGYAMNRARQGRTQTARPEQSSLPPQYRSGSPAVEPDADEWNADPGGAGDGGAIRCPECGGDNAADYAFCRHCSAELPE